MLQAHPTYSIQSASVNEYGISIFMLIDCDEGPLDIQIVTSPQQFNSLYQTSRRTLSYCMAEWLVRMGFFLKILRVKGCGSRTSLMLTDDPNIYTYPEYGTDYLELEDDSSIVSEETLYNETVYGVNLTIPSTGFLGRYYLSKDEITQQTLHIYYDYILTNIGKTWWSCFKVDPRNTTISIGLSKFSYSYSNFVDHEFSTEEAYEETVEDIANTVTKAMEQTSGYLLNNKTKNNDGSITLSLYSMQKKIMLDSSFEFEENNFINYDMSSRHLKPRRRVEFYSKYDSNLDNIEIEIQERGYKHKENGKQYRNYTLFVRKYNNDNEIVLSETYSIDTYNGVNEYTNLVNLNSKIIEAYFYDIDGSEFILPTGIFRLGRFKEMKDATEDDFVRTLDEFESIDTNIVLDSGFNNKFVKRLEGLIGNTNILVTSYNPSLSYNLFSECIFNDSTFIYEDITYPSYMLLLYLLSSSKVIEGYIDLNVQYFKGSDLSSTELSINDINIDNYGIEISNPLSYYNYQGLSLDGSLKIVIVLNYMIGGVKSDPTLNEDEIITMFNDAKNLAINKLTTELEMTLEEVSIQEKTCKLVMNVEVNYSYSKDFTLDLTINI